MMTATVRGLVMLLGVACAAGIATPAMAQPRDNGWTVSLVGGGSRTSVVRQTDGALSRVALARMTCARMSDAFLVQMNGFGSSLW